MSVTMRLAQPRVNGYQGFTSQTDPLSLHFDGFANESGAAWPVLLPVLCHLHIGIKTSKSSKSSEIGTIEGGHGVVQAYACKQMERIDIMLHGHSSGRSDLYGASCAR
jgi:hypothetical protein